jgi:predicted deacylase
MAALNAIDLSRDGKQAGHIAVPHSVHRSAYGQIVLPLVWIRNGPGPIALLTAGVHGDEFEGQIALRNLARTLAPEEIRGGLLILPMANAPAVAVSSRVSPIDDLNLNRVFPGDNLGTPTQAIAAAIEELLLPVCDYAFDIHSGGSSLLYDALALTTTTGEAVADARRMALLKALGLGAGMLLPAQNGAMGLSASLDGAMLRQGVVGVSAEFGGAGGLSSQALWQCERTVRRFLAHIGILPQEITQQGPSRPFCLYSAEAQGALAYAEHSGLLELAVTVGGDVAVGDLLGRIHHLHDPLGVPVPVLANLAGRILCLRALPRIKMGDCIAQIGQEQRT